MATGTLALGDYVVHLEHGIGIYRGIDTIMVGESTLEVAILEYEGGDRLNVPLYRLDQLERYRAAGDDGDRPPPKLHKLGGTSWSKVRERPDRPSPLRPTLGTGAPQGNLSGRHRGAPRRG